MNRDLVLSLALVNIVWVFTLMFGGYRVDTFCEVQIVSTGLFPDWALPLTAVLEAIFIIYLKVATKEVNQDE